MAEAPAQPHDREIEHRLIEHAQGGCRESFSRLVQLHQDRLFNFLLRRLRDEHEAEEVAQAALVRAWMNLTRFDPAWRFSTWLYTIAVRLSTDAAQRASREQGLGFQVKLHDKSASDPTSQAIEREERETLWSLADQILTSDERAALWLRYADDAPIEQIAQVLGKSKVAVRVMLHRARKRLFHAWSDGANDECHGADRRCQKRDEGAEFDSGFGRVSCTGVKQ